MPKRRDVTPEELAKIINLRERNTSWLKIEHEIGIPRQIAKRVYREQKLKMPSAELKGARQTVAAEELRKHIHQLVKVAKAFVEIRKMPTFETKQSATDVMSSFYSTPILKQDESYRMHYAQLTEQQVRRISYRNKSLFNSLREHATNVDWTLFTKWQNAWDLCCNYRTEPKQRARKILQNYQNQNLTMKGEEAVNIIIRKLWENITTSQLGKLIYSFNKKPEDEELIDELNNHIKMIFSNDEYFRVAKLLCRETDMGNLSKQANLIETAITHFEEQLDETILIPVILNSPKCKLCPA